VPGRVGLAPDRLPQRQGGLQRRRGAEVDRVPGDGPGMVVFDHGQPRPGRLTGRGHHPQVELGVVGLPDLVGAGRLPAVDQFEHLRVALGPLGRKGPQRRVDAADDRVDARVGRDRPSFPLGDGSDLAVHVGGGHRRRAQRKALRKEPQRLREAEPAPVSAHYAGQAGQPASLVAGQPALQRPVRNPGRHGNLPQRSAGLDMRPQNQPPAERLRPGGLAERSQCCLVMRARHLTRCPTGPGLRRTWRGLRPVAVPGTGSTGRP
jgi:hypothetical protein